MMRVILLDQYMAIKTLHLRNRKYANASEGLCRYRKNLTLRNVCTKFVISRGLQTIKCDVARNDISLEGTLCNPPPEVSLP